MIMSKYTTEVRFICEQYAGLNDSTGFGGISAVIESARSKIFDFNYPIFDEAYRGVLETKILKHYYMREIGLETVGLWKHYLDMKMNEIMPYYNQLYKSELLDFNPLYDVDIITEHTGTKDVTATTKGDTLNNGKTSSYYSDTPQGGVNNLENLKYLTSATINDSSGVTSNENNTTIKDTEQYLEHVKGKNGGTSYAKMLEDYRNTFLNIDVKVINELNDLFMGLW